MCSVKDPNQSRVEFTMRELHDVVYSIFMDIKKDSGEAVRDQLSHWSLTVYSELYYRKQCLGAERNTFCLVVKKASVMYLQYTSVVPNYVI